MANLYEIKEQLLNCIDQETGEIIDTDKFDELQMERDQKLESVALWYKNLLSEADQYKNEKDAFALKEKQAKTKAESLKNYLDTSLHGSKFGTIKVNITYRKSTSVEVIDMDTLPDEYKKSVTTVTADKVSLGKALKVGEIIDGVMLIENQNIQIK